MNLWNATIITPITVQRNGPHVMVPTWVPIYLCACVPLADLAQPVDGIPTQEGGTEVQLYYDWNVFAFNHMGMEQ